MAKRVLYLAKAPFFSGAERALILTLRSLDRTRFEPSVIAGTDGEFAQQVRALGVRCHVLPLVQLDRGRPLSTVTATLRVIAMAYRLRPSIIHANDMPSYQPGGVAARALGIPAVTHLRFPDTGDAYRWFFRPLPSVAIFISKSFQAQALSDAPDVFRGRETVLYDAVEVPELWSPDESREQRLALSLPTGVPIVALTGQISEVKGIWDFVAAADVLRATNAHFAVLGDDLRTKGVLRRQMEERVQTLGLRDRFTFLGFRSDAPRLIQAFDLVVVPSHVEPFGLASLEAMAAGRPVVASRVGGIPEVVVDGETGMLVPVADPQRLAEGIGRMLRDEDLQRQMGQAGRRRASEVFGMPVHAAAMQDLYERLIG